MEIKLLGALDYNKVKKMLKEKLNDKDVDPNEIEDIVKQLNELEVSGRCVKVASAGRLSRFAGDVLEIVGLSENKTLEKNASFAGKVISMGHDSITDHDYCVFALKDVSAIVEQTIIEERFSSFTVKSRREVDFSKAGFFVPDFHDKDGNILENNEQIKQEYIEYMKSLFNSYNELIQHEDETGKTGLNIPLEDARFILPYCYHSNIIMGLDAHCIKDLIIKLTKTKYAKIQELREFGEKLYEIAKENMPYLIDEIDKTPCKDEDAVDEYLNGFVSGDSYEILDRPRLLNSSLNVDDTILISAIMRRFQFDYETAKKIYDEICENNPEFVEGLMRKIAFEGDGLELTTVNFTFQLALTFAVLTHLTRHRTAKLLIPGFVPNPDLSKYITPATIKRTCLEEYDKIFEKNVEMYNHFKNDYGIRDEDLVYFTLAGNMTNLIVSLDGKALEHILALRECSKSHWETRAMAVGMHREIDKLAGAEQFSSILGSTCRTQGICNEGKECCGKVYKLPNCKMPKND